MARQGSMRFRFRKRQIPTAAGWDRRKKKQDAKKEETERLQRRRKRRQHQATWMWEVNVARTTAPPRGAKERGLEELSWTDYGWALFCLARKEHAGNPDGHPWHIQGEMRPPLSTTAIRSAWADFLSCLATHQSSQEMAVSSLARNYRICWRGGLRLCVWAGSQRNETIRSSRKYI